MRALLLVAAFAGTAAAAPSPSEVLRAPEQLPERVIAARRGAAGLSASARDIERAFDQSEMALSLAVVDDRGALVRVVHDTDDARLLVWLHADDLAWTVAQPTRITGRGDVGVWALPGAPLPVTGDGKRVGVRLVGDGLTIEGTIARSALVHVHVPRPGDGRGTHALRGPILRSPDGVALVKPTDALAVRVIDRGPAGWVLVEHTQAYARVVGWARERDLDDEEFSTFGFGRGAGIGMSHTARIDVEAGACMFTDDGAVVGVQLARSTRYAHVRDGGAWSVYVNTPWGLATPIVIDRANGNGPAEWTPCP